jgi:hypothetical protein
LLGSPRLLINHIYDHAPSYYYGAKLIIVPIYLANIFIDKIIQEQTVGMIIDLVFHE